MAEDPPAASRQRRARTEHSRVASWGGAYGQSQEIAYFEPFAKKTGVKITTETYDGTLATIKDKLDNSTSPFDVVDFSQAPRSTSALPRRQTGALEKLSMLTPGPQQPERRATISSPAASPLAATASVASSTAITFGRRPGQGAAVEDRRSPRRSAPSREDGACRTAPATRSSLRLLADGVEPDNVYSQLAAPGAATTPSRRFEQDQGAGSSIVGSEQKRESAVFPAAATQGGDRSRLSASTSSARRFGRPPRVDVLSNSRITTTSIFGDFRRATATESERQALHRLATVGTIAAQSRADRLSSQCAESGRLPS